jgi:hypothetical protein
MDFPIKPDSQLPLFWVATVMTMGTLALTAVPLARPGSRLKIVALELARTASKAADLMRRWGPAGQRAARVSVYFDFAFLVAYSTFLALACAVLGRVSGLEWVTTLGATLALALWAAGALDAVENIALLQMLRRPTDPGAAWAAVSFACAAVKFLILIVGAVFVAVAGSYAVFGRHSLAAMAVWAGVLLVVLFAWWVGKQLNEPEVPAPGAAPAA